MAPTKTLAKTRSTVSTVAETAVEPTTEAVAEALSRYIPAVVAEASAIEARMPSETTATEAAIAVSAEATTGKSNSVVPTIS